MNNLTILNITTEKINYECMINNKMDMGCLQQNVCDSISQNIAHGGIFIIITYIIFVYFGDWFFDKFLLKNSDISKTKLLKIKNTIFQSIILCLIGFVAYVSIISLPFFNRFY